MARLSKADTKLLAASAAVIVAAGLLVGGGILVATRDGEDVACGPLRVGALSDVRDRLEEGGPEVRTGGARCHFILDLAGGEVVAYLVNAPGRDCSVRWDGSEGTYKCGGAALAASDLAQFPVDVETVDGVDTVIVDLRPAARR